MDYDQINADRHSQVKNSNKKIRRGIVIYRNPHWNVMLSSLEKRSRLFWKIAKVSQKKPNIATNKTIIASVLNKKSLIFWQTLPASVTITLSFLVTMLSLMKY